MSGGSAPAAPAGKARSSEQVNRSLALALVLTLLLVGLYVTSTRPATLAHRELVRTARHHADGIAALRARAQYLIELKRGLETDATTVERVYREVYADAAEPGEKKLAPGPR